MDFESAAAEVRSESAGGFDPSAVSRAIRDAGFGHGEISLEVVGAWTRWQELPALELPGRPPLMILAGGDALESLLAAELPPGSRLVVQGVLHPVHAEHPPGMTVDEWRSRDDAAEDQPGGP